ncbi:hypothetical protein [Rhizobium phaseoli]|uniref:hypothetical protein n=1 Tax=Rhizobium phaseoli TaxID=396 RepID=UPI0007EAC2B5|nr:hypothetical protein [Rhizobium phaseoli]ANL35142.1 hypothetical protein AMC89_CH03106 [Rhizobium phaseoli]ANL98865.1 hypothetical protein AMC79_CH03096 [Rhizobium phaseoli]
MARGAFEKAGRWADNHKITIVLLVSAVCLAVVKDLGEAVLDPKLPWLARLGCVTLITTTIACAYYGSLAQARLAVRNSELEEQLELANELIRNFGSDYFAIWDNRLKVLAEVLGFDARDRISVYRHEGTTFTMVGRFAMLPELDKPGRGFYPVDQGVIGAAWKSGTGKCIVQDLPDPVHDIDGYCTRSRDEWGLPIAITKKLSMKARSVAAFALNNHENAVRSAIVVFESTDPNRFSPDTLEQHIKGTTGKDIAHLLKIIGEREPSPDFAAARGF